MITSYSSLSTYTLCKRAWYLGEYRSLQKINDDHTGPLGFGSRIHEALERWGKNEVASPTDAWPVLMSQEYQRAESKGFDFSELDKENDLGRIMLEGFMNWFEEEGSDQEFEVIDVEKKLSHLLHLRDDLDIWVYGKLDQLLLNRQSGLYWILDYKTTRNLPEAFKDSMEWSPQPRIYANLINQDLGLQLGGIRYTALRKVKRTAAAKPPFYFNYDLHLSPYNIQQHMARVQAVAEDMISTTERLDKGERHEYAAPFNPGWKCKTCPFRNVCYVMQTVGDEAAEDMIEDQFEKGDPFTRYQTQHEQEEDVA